MMAFIGVRNSWLMLAKKALFVRLACSAATRASSARKRASSACPRASSASARLRRASSKASARRPASFHETTSTTNSTTSKMPSDSRTNKKVRARKSGR